MRVAPRRAAEEKIARVSGADIDLFEQSLTLEIRGSDAERARAKRYIECVMAQRVGPVQIDDDADDDDLTTLLVPSEAVGFVTGAQGNFLRSIEEEWGTLMFFADFRGRDGARKVCAQCRGVARDRNAVTHPGTRDAMAATAGALRSPAPRHTSRSPRAHASPLRLPPTSGATSHERSHRLRAVSSSPVTNDKRSSRT